MYYTYILKSKRDNSYYIGQTQDIKERLEEHNQGLSKSTKSKRPYQLEYHKAFDTRKEAIRYERCLKSLKKRIYLDRLIAG